MIDLSKINKKKELKRREWLVIKNDFSSVTKFQWLRFLFFIALIVLVVVLLVK